MISDVRYKYNFSFAPSNIPDISHGMSSKSSRLDNVLHYLTMPLNGTLWIQFCGKNYVTQTVASYSPNSTLIKRQVLFFSAIFGCTQRKTV